MMCRLIILFNLLICLKAQAQINLVIDPSMEEYPKCPDIFSANEGCYTWHSLDSVNSTNQATVSCTPVYLNICSSSTDNSVPISYGTGSSYQYPRSGNGMYGMGFYLLPSVNTFYNRDYLRGRIRGGLINGKQYCGKFYVSLFNTQYYAVDRFCAYLDNGALDINSPCLPIVVTPTFENPAFNYISDTLGWQRVQGSFTANGTETYITIGNFYSHANTNKIIFNAASNRYGESYYYVDDVSIIATDITAYAGNDVTICVSDSIHLGRPQEIGLECLWYKPTIATPFATTSDIWFKPTQAGVYTFVQRMDNCAITWDTVNVTVVQDCNTLGAEALEAPNVFTPNADGVNDVFTFSVFSAKSLVFNIYDRWGIDVIGDKFLVVGSQTSTGSVPTTNNPKQTTILWDGRTTSGIACSAGVYFYVLEYTDAKGDKIKKNGYVSLIR
jgi:hypothetical protein